MKRTTIYDVAKQAGVSKTTVSKILNGKGNVRENTFEKVTQAMKVLNYVPNCFAQSMRTNRTKTIAILLPEQYNYGYTAILQGAQDYAHSCGYLTLVCSTGTNGEKELDYLKEMYRRKVDGIVFFTYSRIEKNVEYLLNISKDTAVVVMDNILKSEAIDLVISDGFNLSKEGTCFFAQNGLHKIAYIKGEDKYSATKERFLGYCEGLKISNINYDNKLVMQAEFSVKGGYDAAKKLLSTKVKPQAIMCATDLLAIGALNYLMEIKVKVPEEIKVLGFDNTPFCTWTTPKLSTISQNQREVGKVGIEQLLKRVKNKSLPCEKLLLGGEIVLRETT